VCGLFMLYRHCPEYNMLVAFGGYNGKYHNAVSVYKLPNQAPQASQQAGEQQQASQPAQQPPQQEPKPQQLQPQQDSDQQPGPTSAQVRVVSHTLHVCMRLVCWEPGRCCCFKHHHQQRRPCLMCIWGELSDAHAIFTLPGAEGFLCSSPTPASLHAVGLRRSALPQGGAIVMVMLYCGMPAGCRRCSKEVCHSEWRPAHVQWQPADGAWCTCCCTVCCFGLSAGPCLPVTH